MNLIEKLKELDDEKQQKLLEKIKKEGDRYGVYPLTMAQYLLWCGYSAGENVVHHSNPGMMIRMKGISREKVIETARQLRQMQDPLRYRFVEIRGSYFQYIDDDTPWTLLERDLSDLAGQAQEDALEKCCEEFYFRPIDLIDGFPAVFELITLSETEYILLISTHHIVSDGMTIGVLYQDFCSLLAGTARKQEFQFGHYAMLKNSEAGLAEERKNRDYWVEEIRDMDKYLDEPTDYSRDSDRADNARDVVRYLTEAQRDAVGRTAARLGCSAYNVLSSLFSFVLQTYTQKQDLILATTLFNRDDPKYRNIAGDFASVIPLVFRGDRSQTLDEYILNNTENFKTALKHGDVAITHIQQEFPHDRRENANPLYQIVFVYHNENLAGSLETCIDGTEITLTELYNEKRQSHYTLDMCVEINHSENRDLIRAHYCQKLFERETVENLIEIFQDSIRYLDVPGDVKLGDMILGDPGSRAALREAVPRVPEGSEAAKFPADESFAAADPASERAVCILGKDDAPLPAGFFGDVWMRESGQWYRTWRCGRVTLDGRLELDTGKSDLVLFQGGLCNRRKAKEAMEQAFSGISVSLDYLDESHLILNYSGISGMLNQKDVSHLCGFAPTLIYKTERSHQEYVLRHQEKVLLAMDLLQEAGCETWAVQQEDSDEVCVVFAGEKAAKQAWIDEIYGKILDEKTEFCYLPHPESWDGTPAALDEISSYRYHKKTRSDMEQKLAEVWREILGHEDFGVYDHFYEVGGNSVKIIKLLNALKETFELDLKITDLFIYNTIHQQGQYISEQKELTPEVEEAEVLSF